MKHQRFLNEAPKKSIDIAFENDKPTNTSSMFTKNYNLTTNFNTRSVQQFMDIVREMYSGIESCVRLAFGSLDCDDMGSQGSLIVLPC